MGNFSCKILRSVVKDNPFILPEFQCPWKEEKRAIESGGEQASLKAENGAEIEVKIIPSEDQIS